MNETRLAFEGLNVNDSSLSRSPGCQTVARNMVIASKGVGRIRNGFARADVPLNPLWKIYSSQQLADNLLINVGSATQATDLVYTNGIAAETTISSAFTNQPGTRMQAAVVRRNHFLTSDEGVRRLETDFDLFFAGQSEGLPASAFVLFPAVGAGTIIADGWSVAYRVTFFRKDVQGNEIEGAPSGRTIVFNNAGTPNWQVGLAKDAAVSFQLPKAVGTASTSMTTSDYIRVWRSSTADPTLDEPPDDMRLVYEQQLTAGDIAAGVVLVNDQVPEAFRVLSPPLYTNPNDFGEDGVGGPGIQQANLPPPLARSVELHADCLWFANLTYRQELEFTILSVVAATGLTAGDVLTIAGVAYTAVAAVPVAGQFVVYVGGTTSENIARTAMNLVGEINRNAGNTSVDAFYVSGPNDLPGRIRLKERRDNQTAFTAVASLHGSAYRPQLLSAVSSKADQFQNGLAYSKPFRGDAVPRVNFMSVGRDDTEILTIRRLGNTLFIFSTSGIYRVTGRDFSDFSLDEFNTGFHLLGPELVVECDDALWALGREGVVRLIESSVNFDISLPIEPLIQKAIQDVSASATAIRENSWAAAYRSQHKILFGLPTSTTDRSARLIYVFDTRYRGWTSWTFADEEDTSGRSCAVVRFNDDVLFLGTWNGNANDSYLFKENYTLSTVDMIDELLTGDPVNIDWSVQWTVFASRPEQYCHFDEVHHYFNVTEGYSYESAPENIDVEFETERGVADSQNFNFSAGLSPPPLSFSVSIPREVRRAERLKISMSAVAQVTPREECFTTEGLTLISHEDPSTRGARKK